MRWAQKQRQKKTRLSPCSTKRRLPCLLLELSRLRVPPEAVPHAPIAVGLALLALRKTVETARTVGTNLVLGALVSRRRLASLESAATRHLQGEMMTPRTMMRSRPTSSLRSKMPCRSSTPSSRHANASHGRSCAHRPQAIASSSICCPTPHCRLSHADAFVILFLIPLCSGVHAEHGSRNLFVVSASSSEERFSSRWSSFVWVMWSVVAHYTMSGVRCMRRSCA